MSGQEQETERVVPLRDSSPGGNGGGGGFNDLYRRLGILEGQVVHLATKRDLLWGIVITGGVVVGGIFTVAKYLIVPLLKEIIKMSAS